MPKDRTDLANERIDQQADLIIRQAEIIVDLKQKLEVLGLIEEAESEALHKMRNECSAMVIDIQRKHLRCAKEHGCPTEYAV